MRPAGELERSREEWQAKMLFTSDLSRRGASSEPREGLSEPGEHEVHLTDQPSHFYSVRADSEASGVAEYTRYEDRMWFPFGTDIDEGDRVTSVLGPDGTEWVSGAYRRIVEVNRLDTHIEVTLGGVGGT